jgi:hypothetical protein
MREEKLVNLHGDEKSDGDFGQFAVNATGVLLKIC